MIANNELEILQQSKENYDKWVSEVHAALCAPLTFDSDGQILTGVYWLPPIPPRCEPGAMQSKPAKRKRITFRDRLRAWSLQVATKHYNYGV